MKWIIRITLESIAIYRWSQATKTPYIKYVLLCLCVCVSNVCKVKEKNTGRLIFWFYFYFLESINQTINQQTNRQTSNEKYHQNKVRIYMINEYSLSQNPPGEYHSKDFVLHKISLLWFFDFYITSIFFRVFLVSLFRNIFFFPFSMLFFLAGYYTYAVFFLFEYFNCFFLF